MYEIRYVPPIIPKKIIMLKNIYRSFLLFLISPCRISLAWVPWVLCVGGFIASLILFYPGHYGADVETQYAQSKMGLYGDANPPVMSAVWTLLRNTYYSVTGEIVSGDGLIYVFQTFLLWMGVLSVLVSAKSFWRHGEYSRTTYLSVFVAVFLLLWLLAIDLLGRSGDISKDIGMLGPYLLATGFLLNCPTTRWKKTCWICLVLLFLFYGTAVRHNAVFALLPMLLWLAWHILPKKQMIPLLACGMALWFGMLGAIYCFNYKLLGAVPQYHIQERFYADILQLNYRTNNFVLPPNTFGNDFSTLDESFFRQHFKPDILLIHNAFREINKTLPQWINFTQNGVIYSREEFLQHQNSTITFKDFRGRDITRRILDEAHISETWANDCKTLRDAWIERILMNPVVYAKWKLQVFIRYCRMHSIAFLGLSVPTVLMLTICLVVFSTFSRRRLEKPVFPFLMLGWSGLFYILPYLIFLTDDLAGQRYIYWYWAASIIALTLFCHESPLIRSLIKKTLNYWTMILRDFAKTK